MKKKYYYTPVFLLIQILVLAQEPADSTLVSLKDSILKYANTNPDKYLYFSQKLIHIYQKNKQVKKIINLKKEISKNLSFQGKYKTALNNIDEAIQTAQQLKNDSLLSRLYTSKAGIYYYKKDYIPSIRYFSMADSLSNDPLQKLNILRSYAFIKKDIGDYQESLKIFKKIKNQLDKYPNHNTLKAVSILDIINNYWDYTEKYTDHPEYYDSIQYYFKLVNKIEIKKVYLKNLFELNKTFLKINSKTSQKILKKLDSITSELWADNIHFVDPTLYYMKAKYFYLKKDYPQALFYLHKVESLSKKRFDSYDEDVTGLYAKIYEAMGQTSKALQKTQALNKIYRDKEQQRIQVGKVLRDEYDYRSINQKIKKLETQVEKSSHTIQYLSIAIFLSLLIIAFSAYKRKKIQKNYQKLMADFEKNTKQITQIEEKTTIEDLPKSSSIPPEPLFRELVDRLKEFEQEEGFIGRQVNLDYVAKYIGSNKTYTSAVIRSYFKLNFKDFLNRMRVNYVINRMRTSTYFDNYSLHGIATEVGYGTAKTFSAAFKQHTGLSLSEFIKEVKKERRKQKFVNPKEEKK